MARWFKVNALMRNVSNQDTSEILGIDMPVEILVKPIVIDLDRIESYAPSLDKDGDEIEDEVDIITYSGLTITLKVGFAELDKHVRKG